MNKNYKNYGCDQNVNQKSTTEENKYQCEAMTDKARI
jgi:hypothetical protein